MSERNVDLLSLKDNINFNTLSPKQWADMSFQVLREKNAAIKTVDGSGGDHGIDAYEGDFSAPTVIYQFKYFPQGFGSAQKQEVKRSLNTALKYYSGFKWILVCSADPTPIVVEWLESLRRDNTSLEMEFILGSEMTHRLINVPKVRKEYFPNLQDTAENLCKVPGFSPTEMIRRGARTLNDVVIDDRFQATVTTDGNMEIISYSPRPGLAERIPLFTATVKTRKAAEAIRRFHEEGIPLSLDSSDVDLKCLVDLPYDIDKLVSVHAWTDFKDNASIMTFFSSDDPNASFSLHIELKTIREGSKVIFRSNEGQSNSPVLVELRCPTCMPSVDNPIRFSITPRFVGRDVKTAYRGARFLAQLGHSNRLGIAGIDDDLADASFSDLDGMADGAWQELGELYEALYGVCTYFGINPVVDEAVYNPDFIDGIFYLHNKLLHDGEEIKGKITFHDVAQELIYAASQQRPLQINADGYWRGSIFGYACSAEYKLVSKGTPNLTTTECGADCDIDGTYSFTMSNKDAVLSQLDTGD